MSVFVVRTQYAGFAIPSTPAVAEGVRIPFPSFQTGSPFEQSSTRTFPVASRPTTTTSPSLTSLTESPPSSPARPFACSPALCERSLRTLRKASGRESVKQLAADQAGRRILGFEVSQGRGGNAGHERVRRVRERKTKESKIEPHRPEKKKRTKHGIKSSPRSLLFPHLPSLSLLRSLLFLALSRSKLLPQLLLLHELHGDHHPPRGGRDLDVPPQGLY